MVNMRPRQGGSCDSLDELTVTTSPGKCQLSNERLKPWDGMNHETLIGA